MRKVFKKSFLQEKSRENKGAKIKREINRIFLEIELYKSFRSFDPTIFAYPRD